MSGLSHYKRKLANIGLLMFLSCFAFHCDSDSDLSFSESGGTYNHDISVDISLDTDSALSCADSSDDSTIYYTTDGSEPDPYTSSEYNGSIRIAGDGTSMTIIAATFDSDGNIDQYNSESYYIDYSYTGPGSGGNSSIDGTGRSVKFNNPGMITYDGAGNLYVADTGHDAIRKISITTGVVTTIAGDPVYSTPFDGTGTQAHFWEPLGITYNNNTLYVFDGYLIRSMNLTDYSVKTIAGSITQGYLDNSNPLSARFARTGGVAYAGTSLFIADSHNYCIRKYSVSGGVSTFAGLYASPAHVDASGTSARFYMPISLTTDGTNLYVTDDNYIRAIVIASGATTTLAGDVTDGAVNGIGTSALFNGVSGIVYLNGILYICDTNNHAIRRLDLSTKEVTTFAGSFGSSGYTDGTGSEARFDGPYGICTDGTNLYVTDNINNNVRKIVISSQQVNTLAGPTY